MTDLPENNTLETEAKKPARKKKSTANSSVADLPFEVAMARLEEIVGTLEGRGDSASLDESLRLYEEGVTLVRRCGEELDAAEQRVNILQRTPEGEIKPRPFASTQD